MSQLTFILDLALGLPEQFQKLFDGNSSPRNAAFWLTKKAVILQVAKQHGILLDPIYTLAAWEAASAAAQESSQAAAPVQDHKRIVMLHTGGAGGLHGLAQRFPESF